MDVHTADGLRQDTSGPSALFQERLKHCRAAPVNGRSRQEQLRQSLCTEFLPGASHLDRSSFQDARVKEDESVATLRWELGRCDAVVLLGYGGAELGS
jgi:hypothetical protein